MIALGYNSKYKINIHKSILREKREGRKQGRKEGRKKEKEKQLKRRREKEKKERDNFLREEFPLKMLKE